MEVIRFPLDGQDGVDALPGTDGKPGRWAGASGCGGTDAGKPTPGTSGGSGTIWFGNTRDGLVNLLFIDERTGVEVYSRNYGIDNFPDIVWGARGKLCYFH